MVEQELHLLAVKLRIIMIVCFRSMSAMGGEFVHRADDTT